MSVLELNREPSARDLRRFGLLLGLFAAACGAVVAWRTESAVTGVWVWAAGGGLCTVYCAVPRWRRPIFLAWMLACYPIGWLISNLLLAMIYYLLITPFGLVMRLAGYDPLRRRRPLGKTSYWISRAGPAERSRYFRQF